MPIKKFEKLMQDEKSAKSDKMPVGMKRKVSPGAATRKMDAYSKGGAVSKMPRTPC